jgi:predicted alpha/beta hydrolase family esterase
MDRMSTPRFGVLFLHGWHNRRPPGHWQREAAAQLTARGHRVEYPQLPSPDEPMVSEWKAVAERSLETLASTGLPIVVVCHSLSCLLWLGARPGDREVERILLVAPPDPRVLRGSPEVAGFVALGLKIAVADRPRLTIVASDNDEYCPDGAARVFGDRFGIRTVVLEGQGHLNSAAGYGAWPSLVAWCENPDVAIVPR